MFRSYKVLIPGLCAAMLILGICWLVSGRIHSGIARIQGTLVPITAPVSTSVTAQRVDTAQAAVEYTARRMALARHEEENSRRHMEQRVLEHVQAQLQWRSLPPGSPPTIRQQLQQAENTARTQMEDAKARFEAHSRTRAAIEDEFQRVRREIALAQQQPAQFIQAENPAQGDVGIMLAPDQGKGLWVDAQLRKEDMQNVNVGQYSVIRVSTAQGKTVSLWGEVASLHTIAHNLPAQHVRITVTSAVEESIAAEILGKNAEIEIWTRTVPGLVWLSKLLHR